MPAPETVHLSWDTTLAAGVTVEQFVVFGAGVSVATGAVIKAFSHLEGAAVGEGALMGPYARLRPGADIGPNVVPFGSLATLLVLGVARRKGHAVRGMDVFRAGIWTTPLVLAAAMAALALSLSIWG